MDHLSIPVDKLAHASLEVPYVCNKGFSYDYQGFHTYPSRVGVDVRKLCEVETEWDDWAPFLQAWLWFGLLADSFNLRSDADTGASTSHNQMATVFPQFLRTKSDGSQVLTTKSLYSYISTALSNTAQVPSFGNLKSCVSILDSSVAEIISTSSWQKQVTKSRKETGVLPVVYRVLLSAQILAETLIMSRDTFIQSQSLSSSNKPTFGHSQLKSDLVDVLLEEAGWCKYILAKLPRQLRLRYFLSYIVPFDAKDHISCSRTECKARPPEQPIPYFEPLHTSEDCACSSISISGAEIEPIIERGEIPVLTFAEISGGERQLEITSVQGHETQQSGPQFVAISHVRHMGLGNLGKQALPYCQLASIQLIANDLSDSKTLNSASSPPTRFWIDTICLPVQRRSRSSALRHLRQVYRSASKVVVLDPSLSLRSVASFEDCIVRIRYSSWKQRLWTLQEGILARELYIKFRNRLYQLDEIIDGYDQFESASRLLPQVETAGFQDNTWLERAIDHFDNDIKTAREQDAAFEWYRLQKMLRLAYLALDRYRYFREEDEAEDSKLVLEALRLVYRELPNSADGVAERLRNLEAVQLLHPK